MCGEVPEHHDLKRWLNFKCWQRLLFKRRSSRKHTGGIGKGVMGVNRQGGIPDLGLQNADLGFLDPASGMREAGSGTRYCNKCGSKSGRWYIRFQVWCQIWCQICHQIGHQIWYQILCPIWQVPDLVPNWVPDLVPDLVPNLVPDLVADLIAILVSSFVQEPVIPYHTWIPASHMQDQES